MPVGTLRPPKGHKGKPLILWAVACGRVRTTCQDGGAGVVAAHHRACRGLCAGLRAARIGVPCARGIEVLHRTLKSGTRTKDHRLADAGNLQACLALDMVVVWRVLYLTHLGRKMPDLPFDILALIFLSTSNRKTASDASIMVDKEKFQTHIA